MSISHAVLPVNLTFRIRINADPRYLRITRACTRWILQRVRTTKHALLVLIVNSSKPQRKYYHWKLRVPRRTRKIRFILWTKHIQSALTVIINDIRPSKRSKFVTLCHVLIIAAHSSTGRIGSQIRRCCLFTRHWNVSRVYEEFQGTQKRIEETDDVEVHDSWNLRWQLENTELE